jgi:ribosome-binding protein aMBF1 (putative translation factor)
MECAMMTERRDSLERLAKRARAFRAAARKVSEGARGDATPPPDPTREVAEQFFEQIKAARRKAPPKID